MTGSKAYGRGFMINPRFQLRFLLYMFAIAVLGFGIVLAFSFNYFGELTKMGEEIGLTETHPLFELIDKQKRLLLFGYALSSGIALVFILVGGFVLSHKIASPIVKMRNHMQLFRSDLEHLPPFRLADKDFFPELEAVVNESIEDFTTQLDSISAMLQDHDASDIPTVSRSNDPEDYR